MNSFLDSNIHYSRSFVICGKIDEKFCGSDLKLSGFEAYLVDLLRSRDYQDIVFFEPRRGAYCLDAESARHFFFDNESLPAQTAYDPEHTEEVSSDDNALYQTTYSFGDAGSISDLMNNQGSEKNIKAVDEEAGRCQRLIVSKGSQTITEFIHQLNSQLMKEGNKFVAVFSNLTPTMMESPVLIDLIMHGIDESKGLAIFLARESFFSNDNMQGLAACFGSKFVYRVGDRLELNPRTCIRINYPEEDEIKNLLRHYAMVGTEKGARISFDYTDLEEMANRIMRYSRSKAHDRNRFDNGEEGFLKIVAATIEEFIDRNCVPGRTIDVDPSTIDAMWHHRLDERTNPLDELEREGWGNAREIVEKTISLYKRQAHECGYADEITVNATSDIATARFEAQFVEDDLDAVRPSLPNIVILGPKGTGKTTIARLIAAAYKEAGLLKIGHVVETTKRNFVSPYFGGVETETAARIDEAEEGVLFIDEAHSLAYRDGGVNNEGSGRTIISVLNNAMTNKSEHHFSVILAGYTDEMEALWDLDEGFKGRFKNFIYLDDYPPAILKNILIKKITDKGYTFDTSLSEPIYDERSGTEYEPLGCLVDRIYRERDISKFANVRAIENIADKIEANNPDKSIPITKESFYDEYEDIRKRARVDETWFIPKDLKETCDYILKEFSEKYVGMENVRRRIEDVALTIEDAKARSLDINTTGLHFILSGNPGTGKTTVAGTLARVMYSLGVIGNPEVYSVNFNSLTGGMRGSIGENVTEAVKKAVETQSLLFIDEAHNMCRPDFDGAVSSFMAPLSDPYNPLNVCFAVYEDRLDDFIALDPGFFSRVEIIRLEDYSSDELYQVLIKSIENSGMNVDDEFREISRKVIEKKRESMSMRDGNARFIKRTFICELDKRRIRRCKESGIDLSSEEAMKYIADDIPEHYRNGIDFRNAEEYRDHLRSIKETIMKERIGNEELKSVIEGKVNALLYNSKYPERALSIEPGHYFFKGRPGSGKTTGAAFFAKYMYELGLIENPELKKRSAKDLIGGFLGQTGPKTGALLDGSRGSVLLIDEAYTLAQTGIGDGDTYKLDAINEIVGTLDDESFRKTTCVIFAGYSGDLDRLYEKNEGLKSRITELEFRDFTSSECEAILKALLDESGLIMSTDAETICRAQLLELTGSGNFQNGRTVRKYADILKSNMIDRVVSGMDEETHDEDWDRTILPEDIPDVSCVKDVLNVY